MRELTTIEPKTAIMGWENADAALDSFEEYFSDDVEAYSPSWKAYKPAVRAYCQWFAMFADANGLHERPFPARGYWIADYIRSRTTHEDNALNLTANTLEKHVATIKFVHKRVAPEVGIDTTPIEVALKSLKASRTKKEGRGKSRAITRDYLCGC